MQYLSKAYNYYSGINPATLSGAIDVIVVRHVDEDGQETLASSPFHVRFGKLQVLRAGEKRVTLRLPNNLPPPHVAPFSMKVGEAGEAFFVLETEEDVPEELLTSPVVMPTDAGDSDLPPSPPPSDEDFLHRIDGKPEGHGLDADNLDPKPEENEHRANVSLTHQPFGATEELVDHHAEKLSEVEPLDLNAPPKTNGHGDLDDSPSKGDARSTMSPSSLFDTATSLLPSIPFLSTPGSSKTGSPPRDRGSPDRSGTPDSPSPAAGRVSTPDAVGQDGGGEDQGKPYVSSTSPPPNPLDAPPGESPTMPGRNHKLSHMSPKPGSAAGLEGEDGLPRVKAGEHEGPDIVYGKDIVLDMSGYHDGSKTPDSDKAGKVDGDAQTGMDKEIERVEGKPGAAEPDGDARESADTDGDSALDVSGGPGQQELSAAHGPLIEAFINDLITATAPAARPPLPANRVTDSMLEPAPPAAGNAVPPSAKTSASQPDIPLLEQLSLNDSEGEARNGIPPLKSEPRTPSRRSRFERGASEPPMTSAERAAKPFPLANEAPEPAHDAGGIAPLAATDAAMDYAWDWGRLPSQEAENAGAHKSLAGDQAGGGGAGHVSRSSTMPPPPVHGDAADAASEMSDAPPPHSAHAKLKNVEEDPYRFVLEAKGGRSHTFELSLCGSPSYAKDGKATDEEQELFYKNRITFQQFIEDPNVMHDERLVVRYSLLHFTWSTGRPLLAALAIYRQTLAPPSLASPAAVHAALGDLNDGGIPRPSSGYGWSRWWHRGQNSSVEAPQPRRQSTQPTIPDVPVKVDPAPARPASPPATEDSVEDSTKHYAKTLRLSSDQLKELKLKPGPNTVQFSVTSSYSGFAVCTARIFLWDETDKIVISDIDGTITKSDALGHVFAAIGRDWTHPGIAKLYTDICNNGYKILYLTSRAIGQADTTREYLKSINQGDYRMPEGPVIMSPDRLMASLHREVIMRKPELFKMACLRDIQRLFADYAKEAFYAGFGNRITDAMSYRSVGISASKIYTIDSTGVVKTELLETAGHKGSYMGLNDLVNEVFPPVNKMFKPEFTDFNFWRLDIPDVPLPDFSPPSPALSARSDESGRSRLSVLGKITGIARRSSRQPMADPASPGASGLPPSTRDREQSRSRPSSPLIRPAMSGDGDDDESDDEWAPRTRQSSMPGSFEQRSDGFPEDWFSRRQGAEGADEWRRPSTDGAAERDSQGGEHGGAHEANDDFDDEAIFDDDILAAGEMARVPF